MERELIITLKKNNYDDNDVKKEIECIRTFFPFLESFETFVKCNRVFNLDQQRFITSEKQLQTIFKDGTQKHNSFIISLN